MSKGENENKNESRGGTAPRPGSPVRRPRKRALPRAGVIGGILSAVALVAAGGGLVSAASLAPQSPASRQLEAPVASVPAGSSVGVCPGPARLLEGTPVGTDPQFSPESATAKTAVSAAVLGSSAGVIPGSRLAPLKGAPSPKSPRRAAAAPAASAPAARTPVLVAGVVPQREVDNISVLSADAQDNRQAAAGAVLSYTAEDGDLQGSAAAACQQPGNDLWLVGANTALGRSAVLNLTNASSTPATVSLDLFGSEGLIQAPGSRGLLVAPGSTRSIVLAGLAPGQERLGVRVRSTGGPVAAVIQQSVLRGLTPGGVDFITPGTAPSVSQVVAGLDIQDPAALAALTAKPGFADAGPALEIAVPGPPTPWSRSSCMGATARRRCPAAAWSRRRPAPSRKFPWPASRPGPTPWRRARTSRFAATARLTRGLQAGDAADIAFSAASARLGSQHIVPVPRTGDRQLVFGAPAGRATSLLHAHHGGRQDPDRRHRRYCRRNHRVHQGPRGRGRLAARGLCGVRRRGPGLRGAAPGRDGRQDISAVAVAPEAAGQRQVPVTLGY